MTLRGEPTTIEVTNRLLEVWNLVPDISFIRVMANILSCAGYTASQFTDVLFIGLLSDKKLLDAIDMYEEIIKKSPY